MKKIIIKNSTCFLLAAVFLFISSLSKAQKKLNPVSQSTVTGIALPQGTRNDSRMLIKISAKEVLQLEAKKNGTGINSVEVLYLSASYSIDSLNIALSAAGWSANPSATDKDYLWLQKDGRSVLAYFSADKTQTSVFFGDTNGSTQQFVSADAGMQNQNVPQPDVQQQTPPQTTVQESPVQNPVQQDIIQPALQNGFTFTTTNFPDGWISTVYDDYIQVNKGNIKVYLLYPEKFENNKYTGTGLTLRDDCWNEVVSKYYNTTEERVNHPTTFSDDSYDYAEGAATEKQTGTGCFVGMISYAIPNTGYYALIIAAAPDEVQFRQQFPRAPRRDNNDLISMSGYNKFAVGKNDLIGKWGSGGSSTMNWYSASTGQNVGATGAATGDEFNFNTDGTYKSEHKGATGWVGAMNTYQQNYKGEYAVTDWTVTINHRWDDKTQVCDVWFEAVKGGRILHMTEGPIARKLIKE